VNDYSDKIFLFFTQTPSNMSSSNRQASLSPSERQRIKSRSSSRSHHTSSNIIVPEEDIQHEKPSSQRSKRSLGEKSSRKSAGSSTSNRSTTAVSQSSSTSKKQKSNTRKPSLASPNRKQDSKKQNRIKSSSDTDAKPVSQPNDSQRQDLSSRGLSAVPTEIFQRK